MHLETVAAQLVEQAPACMSFNGIDIRAKYKTTRVMDIVREWERRYETQSIIHYHSPAAIKDRADRVTELAGSQAKVDAALARLWPSTSLNFNVIEDVLAWVESIVESAEDVDIVLDWSAMRATFAAFGWEPGANCEAYFDANDARNVAGYIVGQWLECGHPMATMFIADWRTRFAPLASKAA